MHRSRDTRSRRIAAVLAATCALTLAIAAGAAAGEYHVYSCRTPNGQVAPTDGWSGSTSGSFVYAEDKCSKNGAILAALGDGFEHASNTDLATWTFDAPVSEALVGATLWRAGEADGGIATSATYEYWLAGPVETSGFDECVYLSCTTGEGEPEEPLAAANRVELSAEHLGSRLYLNAACYGTLGRPCKKGEHDPNGYAAAIYLYAADLTLEQTSQPTFSNVEGELATGSTLSGSADLSFHAEDPGSGVYQAVFRVDGTGAGRTVLDENGGRCKQVGQATDGLPDFLYLQPCKPSLTVDVPFDTTALADGAHHLVVSVTDAAGNSTVVLDRKITVSNHPQVSGSQQGSSTEQSSTEQRPDPAASTTSTPSSSPAPPPSSDARASEPASANGHNASAATSLTAHWSTTPKAILTGAYGHGHTVAGRLTAPDGSPVAGAVVQVLYTPAYEGSHAVALASVHTHADGSFSVRLPASVPSSRITFAYSSQPTQAAPGVTAALSLAVTAGLHLSVTPRVSHVDGTIRFSGALHGAPIPRGGKQLVLEARTPRGPWRQFKVIATTRAGAYRAGYRFRLAGPVTYEFRAVSKGEADFPYATGASNVVRVRER